MDRTNSTYSNLRPVLCLPFAFILLSLLALIYTSCDQSFQPLRDNDQYYFSIYGTLDAAADTQWVRVGPAREGINELPDPSGIEVALEHTQSGQTIKMNDSLFASKSYLNYWTTIDIENEQTYQITAVRADGKLSSVTITTPKEIPSPIVISSLGGNYFDIFVDDTVGKLADVQVKWYVIIAPTGIMQRRTYTFPLRDRIEHTEAFGGTFLISVDTEPQLEQIERNSGGNMSVVHRQFFVASGGPEWDDSISSIDDLEYFLNETTTNVENGLGYVIGIDSKWIPLKSCLTPDSSSFIPCEEEKPFW